MHNNMVDNLIEAQLVFFVTLIIITFYIALLLLYKQVILQLFVYCH
jgi:hypothetical protein